MEDRATLWRDQTDHWQPEAEGGTDGRRMALPFSSDRLLTGRLCCCGVHVPQTFARAHTHPLFHSAPSQTSALAD